MNGVTIVGLALAIPYMWWLMTLLPGRDLHDLTPVTVDDVLGSCPGADTDGTHETTCTDCGADIDRCCVHCPTERTPRDA